MAEGPAATTARVVLVMDNELLQRVSTAAHLRTSGFDVIEAADGEEARRVLDSVPVNVVFADLAMPDQTNGLAFLRWLRERHPAIKAIVTSGTEEDMPLDGYGIFLSKPYRLADLDYCFQKVLAAASTPASGTGGAMAADPSKKASPQPGKAQPGSVRPNRPPAPDKADRRDDEGLMAELSRRLGERAARQRAVAPDAAKAARRTALQAYDRARARRLRLVLGFAVGAVVGSGIASLIPTVGSWPVPPSPSTAARPEPPSPIEMATAAPAPAPPESMSPSPVPGSPSPPASVPSSPTVELAAAQAAPAADGQPAPAPPELVAPSPLPPPASLASAGPFPAEGMEPVPATGSQQAPVEPPPNQTPLRRDEAREVQARLRSFSFNPGLVDGVPGAMTEGAIMRYQQNRGQPQTGKVDRELLEQLRQDPAPKIVQRATGPYARPTRSPGPRRSDPFEPVRAAGDRLGRWMESLTR